jgi:hypothetical protein
MRFVEHVAGVNIAWYILGFQTFISSSCSVDVALAGIVSQINIAPEI